MSGERPALPPRELVHPDFDGHLERPFRELTPRERIDWIWVAMQLLRAARTQRGR